MKKKTKLIREDCVNVPPKIVKVMKILFLLLFVVVFEGFASHAYAQNSLVSISFKKCSVREVLTNIEEQSDYSFFYNEGLIDMNREVSVIVENKEVSNVLNSLFKDTDVSYELRGEQIILSNQHFAKLVASQQEVLIKGIVTDDNGDPLPGVTVFVKGTTIGVITNINGNYSISVPSDATTLQFSFVGMKSKEFAIAGQTSINATLKIDTIGLDEVIAVGYGVAKKSDLTGSITRVSSAAMADKSHTNVMESLKGLVPGLNIGLATGASGSADLEIRGATSINASNAPLVVVDGVIYNGNLLDVNPLDIESVDVLKDASSAAVYGSRASSGVIIITTKKGKKGKPKISFTSNIGISVLPASPSHPKPLSPDDYFNYRRDYKIEANVNQPNGFYHNPNELPDGVDFETWRMYSGTPNDDNTFEWLTRLGMQDTEIQNYMNGKTPINWFDEVFQTGVRQDYNLSLSGGAENLSYFWSLNYVDNEGIVVGDQYNNIRSRLNLDSKINDFINIGVNAQFSHRDQGGTAAYWGNAVYASPFGDKFNENGEYNIYTTEDIASASPFSNFQGADYSYVTDYLSAKTYADFKLPFGISYSINFVNSFSWNRTFSFYPKTTVSGLDLNGKGSRNTSSKHEWQLDNIIKWNRTFAGIHKLNATFLYSAEKTQTWSDKMRNENFLPNGNLGYHNMSVGSKPVISNNDTYKTGDAMMGRLNYGLLNRYMLTVSVRRDGYSAFGENNRRAVFPAAALAWIISEESFFKNDLFDFLKFRFSWGENGNREIGQYEALSSLQTTKYIYGNQVATGVYTNKLANGGLSWERTRSINTGIDFNILNNRIDGSVDYYSMSTTDLLISRSLPDIIGFSSVMSNLGEVTNKGFEFKVNSRIIEKEDLKWQVSFQGSLNRNEVKHLYGEMVDVEDEEGNVIGQKESDDRSNGWFIGHGLDQIYDYKIEGVWQVGEEDEASQYGQTPGDFKVRDVNNDGDIYSLDDKIFMGYKKPRFRWSLLNSFVIKKNIKFSFLLDAQVGHYGRGNQHKNRPGWKAGRANYYDLPYWTPENPTNEWSALVNNSRYGNYWVKKSFVRLSDISLSYTLPKDLLNNFLNGHIIDGRIFMSVKNAHVFSNWDFWDPETSSATPRIFSFGFNVTL